MGNDRTQLRRPVDAAHAHVVVIGGGLAGIAAAVRLAGAGLAVTLVETSKRLGGRATSFVDTATGQVLDNCQHVLMGCCTNLIRLYEALGVADRIEWHRRLYFVDGDGRVDLLEADDLAAPLHLTRSLLSLKTFTLWEKIAIVRAMFALIRLGRDGRRRWHDRTFSQWLSAQRQPAGAVCKFWTPIVTGACNERPDRVAADYAMQVFQEGFLSHERAYVMGLSRVPLLQLYDTAVRVIEGAGGVVHLSTSAQQLRFAQGRAAALWVSGGGEISADAFVSALPFDRLARICPDEMIEADPRLKWLGHFRVSPIIGIHVWFDRAVMTLPHLILTESPLQWVFNKGSPENDAASRTGGSSDTAQHLHGVISAAHDLVDQPADVIAQMVVREMRKVLPRAVGARVLHSRVIKEKRATFSARPGIERSRPAAAGAIDNLYLAGDWTRCGWPATMEGAVRSGHLAAAALLERIHLPTERLVPDLPSSAIYQMIGGLD